MHWLRLENSEERVLGRILRRQAEEIPDRPYLMSGDDRYTYGQVNQLANSHAAGLAKLGLAQGDTLAFLMKGSKEFVFSTFGAMKLGAIWVPTNVDYKGEWLRNGLLDSRARVLVVDAAFLPRLVEVWNDLPFEHVVVRGEGDTDALKGKVNLHDLRELGDIEAGEPSDTDIGFGDTAAVLWTSGTTGRAKGVMQSHNAWVRGAESGAAATAQMHPRLGRASYLSERALGVPDGGAVAVSIWLNAIARACDEVGAVAGRR